MKTFRKKYRPARRSLGVLAAPRIFDMPLDIAQKHVMAECKTEKEDKKYAQHTHIQFAQFSTIPIENIHKLAESTFSDIFVNVVTDTVLKIVPLTAKKEYKKVQHTKIDHFIKEAHIMERMNASKHSVKMLQWCIVLEWYPAALIEKCRAWAKDNRDEAENIIPQKNNSSGIFGIIEMEKGGTELSKIKPEELSTEDTLKIMHELAQCVHELNKLGVEHRDMHESNILVKKEENSEYTVKMIDYSLSRAEWHGNGDESVTIHDVSDTELIYSTGSVLYTDIDKELSWLFTATDGQPHREVYKKMNTAYTGAQRWREKGNSNRLWLEYLMGWINNKTSKKA